MTQRMNGKPVETICDGTVEGAIWRWTGPEATVYTVRFTCTASDQPGVLFTHYTYTEFPLLELARLAARASARIAELRVADTKALEGG